MRLTRRHSTHKIVKRFFYICLGLFVTVRFLDITLLQSTHRHKNMHMGLSLYLDPGSDWNFSVLDDNDQKCQLPRLNPFDPSVLQVVKFRRTIECKWPSPQLTLISSGGVLQFNLSALMEAGLTSESIECFYKSVVRRNGKDRITYYGRERKMTGFDTVNGEFIHVRCTNISQDTIYTNLHAYVRHLGYLPIRRVEARYQPSTFVFFIDSLSRTDVIRYLPNTYWFLTRIMGACDMHGMTRIGDNTWPNAVAMLTGKSIFTNEIPFAPTKHYYDDYPAIWKNFSTRAGYVTLLSGDCPEIGIFNYLGNGFFLKPTDYYVHPFWVAMENMTMMNQSSAYCFGLLPRHVIHLNYLHDFAIKYRDLPYFAFSAFTEIGHDESRLLGAADDDIVRFLRNLYLGGHFDNTILFFVGDHGQRFTRIVQTEQGRLEMNMPFSAIFLPSSIRSQYPEAFQNLRRNSKRLTSMFDYYDTFVDILHLATHRKLLESIKRVKLEGNRRQSYSLFASIPSNRTCADAGIPGSYCPCNVEKVAIPIDDVRAKLAADIVINTLNILIQDYFSICHVWNLSNILSARIVQDQFADVITSRSQIVLVMVVAIPGTGKYEGLVRLTNESGKIEGEVLDDISRLSSYRGKDFCVTKSVMRAAKFDLRLYCHCRRLKHVSDIREQT